MAQVKTVMKTLQYTMRSSAFNKGFKEAKAGIPYDDRKYSGYGETNDQWNYERGRQFAFIFNGAIKNGKKITYSALRAFGMAVNRRDII